MAENKKTEVKKTTKKEEKVETKSAAKSTKTTETKEKTTSTKVEKKTTSKPKTEESKLSAKHILIHHAKDDKNFHSTQKAKSEHKNEHNLTPEEKKKQEAKAEDNEFVKEMLGQEVETIRGKDTLKKANPLLNGFSFLFKSFATQWKTLLSVVFIFMTIVLLLALLTYGIQFTAEPGFHVPPTDLDHPGETDFTYLSFFQALWWVFITISTVGFGDIYPLTTAMRMWAIFIGIVGIVFVSLFTAVVVNGFALEMQRNLERRKQRLHKHKEEKDNRLLLKRMRIDMDEKELEIEELKWALAKLSGETIESIEEAMDHAREHAMEYALAKKKSKKNKKTVEANLKKIHKKTTAAKAKTKSKSNKK